MALPRITNASFAIAIGCMVMACGSTEFEGGSVPSTRVTRQKPVSPKQEEQKAATAPRSDTAVKTKEIAYVPPMVDLPPEVDVPPQNKMVPIESSPKLEPVTMQDREVLKSRGRGDLNIGDGMCVMTYAGRHKVDYFHLVGEFGTALEGLTMKQCAFECLKRFDHLREADFGDKFESKKGFERFSTQSIDENFCSYSGGIIARARTVPTVPTAQ